MNASEPLSVRLTDPARIVSSRRIKTGRRDSYVIRGGTDREASRSFDEAIRLRPTWEGELRGVAERCRNGGE